MSERNAKILHIHRPENGLEAKFSAEFAAAASLRARCVTLAELTDAFVQDPKTREIFPLVHVLTEERGNSRTGYASYDEIRIIMKNDDFHVIRISESRGSPGNPLDDQELFEKFSSCLKHACPHVDAKSLYTSLYNLEQVPNIADYMTSIVWDMNQVERK